MKAGHSSGLPAPNSRYYVIFLLVLVALPVSFSATSDKDVSIFLQEILNQQPQDKQSLQQQAETWPLYFESSYSPYESLAAPDRDEEPVQQQQYVLGEPSGTEMGGDVLELPPNIGQTAGVAVDGDQNLVVFHRSNRQWDEWSFGPDNRFNKSLGAIPNSTLAVVDTESGRVLSEHGAGLFFMPHGLNIDADGNVWVTDVGSHQVHKLHPKTMEPLLTVGEKLVPGNDETHFCKPTDVAVARNGNFFVADGYCNSRIMKFNKRGKFLTSFGRPNSEDPPRIGEFSLPHSLALVEDLNLLCVADRENLRIQCFAAGLQEKDHQRHPRAFVPTGSFFTKAENIGRVYAIREKRHYLVGVTNYDEQNVAKPQIFVMDMDTGRATTFAKHLDNLHAIALSDNGDIYVSRINPNQIVKFSVPEEV